MDHFRKSLSGSISGRVRDRRVSILGRVRERRISILGRVRDQFKKSKRLAGNFRKSKRAKSINFRIGVDQLLEEKEIGVDQF